MTTPVIIAPCPIPESPNALVAVDRAVAEMRRGAMVIIQEADATACLIMAAEVASNEGLARLARLTGSPPKLALSGRRAAVLGLVLGDAPVALVAGDAPLTAEQVESLANPLGPSHSSGGLKAEPIFARWAEAALALAKFSRLLPAAIVAPIVKLPDNLFRVSVDDVLGYQQMAARNLRRVAEARLPLADAEDARVVSFRSADGGAGHLAIIVGQPDRKRPVLARLHSECFTGDLLGSLRCDCGDQLRGAIAELSRAGGGVLLYLAQEGRGIGLINKLRAYELQDAGFDTLDANQQLGFDDDERIYLPAAQMLHLLGISQVRLLTNNPAKIEGVARHGITVTARVPHVFPSNGHNEHYLKTKATRAGHFL